MPFPKPEGMRNGPGYNPSIRNHIRNQLPYATLRLAGEDPQVETKSGKGLQCLVLLGIFGVPTCACIGIAMTADKWLPAVQRLLNSP